jgi:chlorite dismutase
MDKFNEKMEETRKVRTFWNEKWEKLQTPRPTKKGDYYVSNYGRIKSVEKINLRERLLKGSKSNTGFKVLNITLVGNKRMSNYVHKFVAENFLPKPEEDKKFVIHLDQNKENNYWKNLKCVSREELTKWHIEIGRYHPENMKRGSNHKLTETKVKMLKKWMREGKTKKKILANRMGISTVQLNKIEKGENWGYVKLDGTEIKNE